MNLDQKHKRSIIIRNIVMVIFSIAILVAATAITQYLIVHRAKPKRTLPPVITPAVQAIEVKSSREIIVISAMGTVIPAVEITLQARVSGQVITKHPEFVEGGIVTKGDLLLGIDPEDYELAITTAEAQLETARYELKIEQGQQDVAKREWELMDVKDSASVLDAELALRQPHLRQKEANLRSAEAKIKQAHLNLERTKVTAPFNAIIQSADVDPGDQAMQQTQLGRLAGTDAYWIEALIPLDHLKWLEFPHGTSDSGSLVRVTTGTGDIREGRVLKLLSDLEPQGRLARLLIAVPDPLCLLEETTSTSPLLLGDYVHVEIIGRDVDRVFAIPRDALRDGERVWLLGKDNRLVIHLPNIIWLDSDRVLLKGLDEGAYIITSDLSAAVEGMEIRLQKSQESIREKVVQRPENSQ